MLKKPLLIPALMLFAAASTLAGDLSISDGWARASIPGQSRSAAYLTITNSGERECVLQSVTSEAAGLVEVHEHRHSGGQMQMRRVDLLAIPPKSTLSFKPGGLHLMLFKLKQPLKEGESVEFDFSAGECGDLSAPFAVKGF